jgi:Trypsin-like peptidase domain
MSLTHDQFLADVAAVYSGDSANGAFGSGRLIAPGLILTAGHVVDHPTREAPMHSGWKVCLLRNRNPDGSWAASAHEAKLVWRGQDNVDLALLQLIDQTKLKPELEPVFVSYNLTGEVEDVSAAGFPQGWLNAAGEVRDYTVNGALRIASQLGPFAWSVHPADKPDKPKDWKGMSGAAVCCIGGDDKLYLFGAVQEIPANFSDGLLEIARLCKGFDDVKFFAHLQNALGVVPRLTPFLLEKRRSDNNQSLSDILRPIPVTHRLKIQNFVKYYLGTQDQPVPFGGRRSELNELTSWLNEVTAPRHLLVTAPAGRGKTALLVSWMQSIPHTWNVVFVPISIRFQTNHASVFYEAMAHQLARIAAEKSGFPSSNASEFFKDRCLELLYIIAEKKIPTLVIVDGLDEAMGWEVDRTLLQSESNSTIRIIASARALAGDPNGPEAWRQRLDWAEDWRQTKCIGVPPLSRDGIGEALESMGYPVASLVSRVDILGTLKRLTGGDPLLVRIYADSLWKNAKASQRIEPEELEKLDPGYGGFFKDWFSKQSGDWSEPNSPLREKLEGVLAGLSVALGPIEHQHLETVCGIMFHNQSFSLSIADIEPIKRFLIGDGNEIGYSFQHPKFEQYFKDDYFKNGRKILVAEAAIKAWGNHIVAELNSLRIEAKNVPLYVLNYYVFHLLKAADDAQEMESLLFEGWQRAWFEHDNGYVRYEADIVALMDAFKLSKLDEGSQLTLRVRCGLILSSIRSTGVNTPSELLIALIRSGKLSSRQALQRIRFQDDVSLAKSLPSLFDVADPTIQVAILELAEGIGDYYAKAQALGSLAARLPDPRRTELLEWALTAAEGIRDDWDKAQALGSLAERLPEELLERALTAAEGVVQDRGKAKALGSLAARLPEELLERALTAAEGIRDDGYKAQALGSLAERLPEPRRTKLLERALTAADWIRDDGDKAQALGSLAERLPEPRRTNLLERALTAAEKVARDRDKAKALGSLAARLPEKLLERALTAAEGIGNVGDRAVALGSLAARLPEELLERALTAAEGIKGDWDKAQALGSLAARLPEELLERALTAAEGIRHQGSKALALGSLAERLPEPRRTELLERALTAAEGEGYQEYKAEALGSLAARLPEELLERALTAAEGIGDDKAKVQAIGSLAACLPEPRRTELLERALTAAEGIRDDQNKAYALESLAARLPEPLLERALTAAEGIGNVGDRAVALGSLAEYLPEELMERAVTAAEEIGYAWIMTFMLAGRTPAGAGANRRRTDRGRRGDE